MFGAELVGRMADADAAAWGAVLAAPFIGSFLGVVVQRPARRQAYRLGPVALRGCAAALAVRDLVPLLSWLAAAGRCRFCRRPLGWFYPGIELAALAVALLSVSIDRGMGAWLDCVLGWWLLALGWIDLRTWLLPDALTLPLVIAGLAAAMAFEPEGLTDRALGAVAGYLGLRAVGLLYRALRGREGLGHGDAKLLAAAGAWVGARALPQVVLLAALAGLCAVACLRLAGIRLGAQSALRFGPFLAFATWLVWLAPALTL